MLRTSSASQLCWSFWAGNPVHHTNQPLPHSLWISPQAMGTPRNSSLLVLAMREVFETIAVIWTAIILAYGATAVAVVLAHWALEQARSVRHPSGRRPSPKLGPVPSRR